MKSENNTQADTPPSTGALIFKACSAVEFNKLLSDAQVGRPRALAANKLLDRGYGRPAQTIAASLNRRSPEEMTDAELLAIAGGSSDGDEEKQMDDSGPTGSTRVQ